MNATKFDALIRLLDDNDPEVLSHVENELTTLGTDGIGMLESAWEKAGDSLVQSRLEELIRKIQITHFTDELYKWRLGGGQDLTEGWLMLNQIQYPTLNVQKYRSEIKKLCNKIFLEFNPQMNDIERLCVVNKHIYMLMGFTGNYKEPERPENNYLSYLFDTKRGSSLSLTTLYQIVCQEMGIQLQVVNFMGYFALRYYRTNSHFYIDAYNKGMFFTPKQVQQFLQKLNADTNVAVYKPLSNIYTLLHLIHSLAQNYRKAEQVEKAEMFERLLKAIEIKIEG